MIVVYVGINQLIIFLISIIKMKYYTSHKTKKDLFSFLNWLANKIKDKKILIKINDYKIIKTNIYYNLYLDYVEIKKER
jgi:hypothetical protein